MKKLFTIALLLSSFGVMAQSKKISNQKTINQCYDMDQKGVWKTIGIIAYSYINENGDLKWKYCDQIKQKAISFFQWPTNCKTGKKIPIRMIDYNPSYNELQDYYIDDKRVQIVDLKRKDNYLDTYSGSWDIKTLTK